MLKDNIEQLFFEGLKEYVLHEEEEHLTHAYEMGRKAVQEGLSEIDIISLHQKSMLKLDGESDGDLSYQEKIQLTTTYLKEWLVPFEVKLDSYRNVIDELQEKNDQLKEEVKNRREVQRELVRSKEYFQSLIENAQDIITVIDHNAIIRYSSPSIERILGYGPGELVGREAFQYLHENDIDRVQNLFQELITTPDHVVTDEFRFQHKDGGWVYLESIAKNVQDSPDGPIVIVNSRDVTERKRAIRKLEEHKIQLAEAQQIANVGSWQWKIEEEEVLWSDEMARIYGFDPGNFDNSYETFIQHVHPEDRQRLESVIERALDEKNSFEIEHHIIRVDDKERVVLARGHTITDEDNNIVKMIGTGQDVTEQKAKEKKLREYSEELRNLSEKIERAREEERIRIARKVHDELGQMLTVLKMDVSMVRGEMQKHVSEEILSYFNTQATKILDRINVIIKSVQRITTELRPEVLDDLGLKEAIDWQAHEFEKRTGIGINFESNVNHSFLNDEKSTTLFRIFQEILTNIIRHAEASQVDITLNKEKENLFLIIKDDGIGITKKEKEASSSLGIIGMRERTKFLGGGVEIRGEKNKGTTVKLRVPLNGNQ